MATISEDIKAQLAKCWVTLWEPEKIERIQMSSCRLNCVSKEISSTDADGNTIGLIKKISDAIDALNKIETDIVDGTNVKSLTFDSMNAPKDSVWSMMPNDDGVIYFGVNQSSLFFNDYIIPAVSTTLVPTTDASGNPRSAADILRDRKQVLKDPMNVLNTTITALGNYKAIVDGIITTLANTAS